MNNNTLLNRIHSFLTVVRDCQYGDISTEAEKLADEIYDELHKYDVIHIEAGVRYAEDASVNGEDESDDTPQMPCLIKNDDGWLWKLDIDIKTGHIINWKNGIVAKSWYKVCDECKIICGNKVYDEYVPNFLSPDENGYGDYMYMTISEDGYIKNWNSSECIKFINEL